MGLKKEDVVARVERLSISRLEAWVERDWVRPEREAGEDAFSDADIARLQLICLLQDELELGEEALPVVLSLIDQLHGVRRALHALAQAVEGQPLEIRGEISRDFCARLKD